jgi:hypothetical protein
MCKQPLKVYKQYRNLVYDGAIPIEVACVLASRSSNHNFWNYQSDSDLVNQALLFHCKIVNYIEHTPPELRDEEEFRQLLFSIGIEDDICLDALRYLRIEWVREGTKVRVRIDFKRGGEWLETLGPLDFTTA